MGAKSNVCNVGPYHKPLKYSMIRIIMIHTQFKYECLFLLFLLVRGVYFTVKFYCEMSPII